MSAPQQVSAFNNQIPPRYTIKNITAAYTVTGADYGVILNCTGATSYTLGTASASSVGAGFNVWVWNQTATTAMSVTIDPNGTETIDGASTLILRQGEGTQIVSDGTNWQTNTKKTMRGYAEAYPATLGKPVAIGQSAVALGLSYASGQDSFAAAIGSNSASYGAQAQASVALGGFALASGTYSIAMGYFASAATYYSTAIGNNSSGGGSQAVTSDGAMALGGSYASGIDSFAAAIANNTSSYGATGTNSVAIGKSAKATALGSVAIGVSSIYGGPNATGQDSIAIGDGALATTTGSFAIGGKCQSSQIGKFIYGWGVFSVAGDAQTGTMVLRAATTGSAVVMTSNGSAAGSTNQLVAASNQVFAVTGTLIGKQSASANIAAYTISATVVNNAGTLTVPTATLTLIGTDSIGLTTSPTLTADATNLCMAVTSGAKTATNIRWVCTLQTSEVIYA